MIETEKKLINTLTQASSISILSIPSLESAQHHSLWYSLRLMFQNYFTGNHLLKNVQGSKREVDLLEAIFNEYLALYDLINWGWAEIQKGFSGIEIPANTPGEALEFILVGISGSQWKNKDKVANATTLYRAYQQYKKCKALQEQGKINDSELKELDKYVTRLKKKVGSEYSENQLFKDTIIDICLRSKKQKIRDKAKLFLAFSDEHSDLTAKWLRTKF